VKRLVSILSVVSLLNVMALAALAGYAWSGGWLAPDRVRAAASILRDGVVDGVEEVASTQPTGAAATIGERIEQNEEAVRVRRAELDRRQREIEQAWQQLETQQLAFLKERESFETARRREAAEADERARKAGDSGWQRELELMGTMKAKLAKSLLKEKPDAEVVKVLMELDIRKAKKIVEQCKTSEERQWIGRILGQLQDRSASQAEALGAGTVSNPGA